MENLIQVMIYIISVVGIIITSISIVEFYNFKNNIDNSYKIYDKNIIENKRVQISINIRGLNSEEEKDLIDKIINGKYKNLEDIVDCLKIEKI